LPKSVTTVWTRFERPAVQVLRSPPVIFGNYLVLRGQNAVSGQFEVVRAKKCEVKTTHFISKLNLYRHSTSQKTLFYEAAERSELARFKRFAGLLTPSCHHWNQPLKYGLTQAAYSPPVADTAPASG
jgi:hypothetical protein